MENSININIVDSKKVMAAVKSDQIQEIDKQIEDNKIMFINDNFKLPKVFEKLVKKYE